MFLRQAISRNTLPFEILPIKKQVDNTPIIGSMKGKIKMAEDFDAPLDDFIICKMCLILLTDCWLPLLRQKI